MDLRNVIQDQVNRVADLEENIDAFRAFVFGQGASFDEAFRDICMSAYYDMQMYLQCEKETLEDLKT